jgi:hypothetical protein
MQWETLLGGALAGGVVNIVWNYFSKKIDFEIDYKKYIVRRRQECYDKLSEFITKLSETQSNGQNRIPGMLFPSNHETIIKFNEDVNLSFKDNIWFSSEMTGLLLSFSSYAYEIRQASLPIINESELELFCAEQYQEFSNYRVAFQKQLMTDFIELPDIKKFRKKLKDHFPIQ